MKNWDKEKKVTDKTKRNGGKYLKKIYEIYQKGVILIIMCKKTSPLTYLSNFSYPNFRNVV